MSRAQLTMGPLLFHWPAEKMRDFWFRIADQTSIDVAYLGETICSKRTPFFDKYMDKVSERLASGGKKVVWSTLCEVVIKRDRNDVAKFCAMENSEIEANDASALYHLSGHPHRIGQAINVYNETALAFLAMKGATSICLPVEIPAETIAVLARQANKSHIKLEVQVFGRVSLALSARCYHARANNRTKDNCQFVCQNDPDGMELKTSANVPFLAINGIQTLSYRYLDLSGEMKKMSEMGISAFRLSPHTQDMVAIASRYRELLDGVINSEELKRALSEMNVPEPMMNGFYHGQAGCEMING